MSLPQEGLQMFGEAAVMEMIQRMPRKGFFEPYKNAKDFGNTLISPIARPVVHATRSIVSLVLSGFFALASVATAVGGLVALIPSRTVGLGLLVTSALSALASLTLLANTFREVVATILSGPAGLIKNVTRPVATLAHR